MTRETKLGLVVAGSFLALVGGVVVARLRQIEMPGDAAEPVALAGPTENPPADAPIAPEPKKLKNPVPSDAVANAGATKMPAADSQPAPAPVAQAPAAVKAPAGVNPPPASAQLDTQPAAAPVKAAEVIAPTFPIESKPDPTQFVGPPLPLEDVSPPTPIPQPTPIVSNPTEPKSAPNTPPAGDAADPPAVVTTLPDKPAVVTTLPEKPAVAPTLPDKPAVVTTSPDKPMESAPVVVQPSPVAPAPIPEMPAPPAPSPSVVKQPAAEAPVAPPPLNPSVANNAVPTVTVIPASGGNNTAAALDAPRVPSAGPARDQVVVAPARPAAPPEPKRDSYLEETYRWSAGDSFETLSTKNYGTPKYADALLKYNQDYPLASREMRQNPPAVTPGQVVWVPPVRILERDYANQIRDLTPVVPATPTARPTVEPVAPPPGLANSGFGNTAGQLYRVRTPGESLQEIARRTLNSSAQSARIQQLNPTLSPDPRLPIPAGTVLRLPGEANVDKADKP